MHQRKIQNTSVCFSERRLGAALRGRPRAGYVASSKVGKLLVPNEEPHGVDTEGFVVRDGPRRLWWTSAGTACSAPSRR